MFVAGACATAAIQSSAALPETPPTTPAKTSTGAEVTSLAEAERRRAPNDSATVVMLARGDNAFVARLEMEPGASVPTHRDATEEYIVILEGSGTMSIDGQSFELQAGDTAYMPANAEVRFQNADTPLVGLQVFAGPEPAEKYDAWTPIEPGPL